MSRTLTKGIVAPSCPVAAPQPQWRSSLAEPPSGVRVLEEAAFPAVVAPAGAGREGAFPAVVAPAGAGWEGAFPAVGGVAAKALPLPSLPGRALTG